MSVHDTCCVFVSHIDKLQKTVPIIDINSEMHHDSDNK